jgi:hypothetical protein
MYIQPTPPIVVNNPRDNGITVFLTLEAMNFLEPWYITDEEFDAYDVEGRAVELRLDEHGNTVVCAVEVEPAHASELRTVLLQALKDAPPAYPGIETLSLSDLVAVAAERLDVVPWESNSVLARAFRRIRKRGQ